MKISVLLPTRDRLELLRHAVASVTRLDDRDWEIVISDNCSSGDVAGYVASLADARIRYVRAPQLLSITQNWNNALAHSTGDYVLMLGDDDALLGGYFTTIRKVIADFDEPQMIYHNALRYAYPGVVPDEPNGYLRGEGYARFLRGGPELPFRLPVEQARALARSTANFRLRYGFNMQYVTFSRSAVEELSRECSFFRSPFPDFYAMTSLFARASSIVAEPRPLLVMGMSSHSGGFYYSNDRDAEGWAFFTTSSAPPQQPAPDELQLIPGTTINDGWLRAVEEVHRRLGRPASLKPNYRRYRMLQIVNVYSARYLQGRTDDARFADLKRRMTRVERLVYGMLFAVLMVARRILPERLRPRMSGITTLIARQVPWWDPVRSATDCRDISEVVELVDGDSEPASWGAQNGSRLKRQVLWRVFP
jgi:Glycosyl transferase family 2